MELKLENKELDYDKVQSLIDLYKVIIYEQFQKGADYYGDYKVDNYVQYFIKKINTILVNPFVMNLIQNY